MLRTKAASTMTPARYLSNGTIYRKCACGGTHGPGGECAECGKKRMALQRKETGGAQQVSIPPVVNEVLRSPGQPLDSKTRTFFEHGFGDDFGKVRLHSTVNPNPPTKAQMTDNAATSRSRVAFGTAPQTVAKSTPGRSSASDPSSRTGSPGSSDGSGIQSSMHVTSGFAGGKTSFNVWPTLLHVTSPLFSVSGSLTVPPSMANGDLTVGFMQAVRSSTGPTGNYFARSSNGPSGKDQKEKPYMSQVVSLTTSPVRDAVSKVDPVFYNRPPAQSKVGGPKVSVSMTDQPQTWITWKTHDGKGMLRQTVGRDRFVTWLVILSDSTRRLTPLRYVAWSVNWSGGGNEHDFTSFGRGSIDDHGEGQGPLAPIRGGPRANDCVQSTWTHGNTPSH